MDTRTDVQASWLLGAALLGVTATTWLVVGLFAGRLASTPAAQRDGFLRRGLLAAHHALGLTPALWIVLTVALVARAALAVGEWPSSSMADFCGSYVHVNPPPESFGAHYGLVSWATPGVLASVLLFPPTHLAARRLIRAGTSHWLSTWCASWLLAVAIVFYDGPYAIARWLL